MNASSERISAKAHGQSPNWLRQSSPAIPHGRKATSPGKWTVRSTTRDLAHSGTPKSRD